MNVMEIVLLVAGVVVFVLSFLIPDKSRSHTSGTATNAEDVKKVLEHEIENAKIKLQDELDETLTYSVEKAERALERISNEKIMAVSEFSDTVLEQINTNHKETIFLYDMLNDKQREINSTARFVNKTVKESAKAVVLNEDVEVIQDKAEKLEKSESHQIEQQDTNQQNAISNLTHEVDHSANSNDKILTLYRQGLSKVAIAKELGLGVGEVKLVIDLFQGIQ